MQKAVCLGETMAVLSPPPGESLRYTHELRYGIGGAESNVALGLAALGIPSSWISRVGNDSFGRRILDSLGSQGVEVAAVQLDPERQTGVYVKASSKNPGDSELLYYRAGSAASAMSGEFLEDRAVAQRLDEAGLIHFSGITAALSPSCLELCHRLLARPRRDQLISFDLNWRPALWRDGDPTVLRTLANLADIVLLGADEALLAFGTRDEAELRALLPTPGTLVIKNDAHTAISLRRADKTQPEDTAPREEVAALTVEIAEPIGAGDSFAAGYLSGVLLGLDERSCLRRGHLAAACTLTVHADRGQLPEESALAVLLGCTEEEWNATTVTEERIDSPVLDGGYLR
ncbi:sugar kinase [Psychromicrobium xiongbiense]|uniref:sugar kinase n=1 Tax=Psychromicrobium xiongbiense TaxID=3051184 RepID=UPI002556CDDD|nr:sugar kinase [Psychromicrobium sp. YIM S02556]